MPDIHQILHKYWGYTSFRPLQEDIILSALAGHDTLALLPTGGGKSICFQVPAMALEGLCVVISPLIALMKDQVENLEKKGIPALALHSGLSRREIDLELDNAIRGKYKFLYVSPERLKTDIFRARVVQMKVCLLAIDEAHCISQWGYDFRPEYLQISEIRPLLGCPVLALTATATARVVEDIQDKLHFRQRHVFRKSFERKNLSYVVLQEENKLDRILKIAERIRGTGVIYARNRRLCKELAEFLWQNGHSVDFYHAGLDHQQRNKKQEDWIKGRTRIIVSTNAFGMGIDKPDVRFVVHYEMPDSLEAYYQEAGRAGRDEQKAWCIALYQPHDRKEALNKLEKSFPPYEEIRRVYDLLCNYLRIPVNSGAGVTVNFDIADFCNKCDLPPGETFHALKILEQQEIIYLSEAFFQPSRLHFTVDNTVLYDFELRNPGVAGFIKLLLRTYGGLFDQFVRIDESYLARKMNVPAGEITKLLKKLQEIQLLNYEESSDTPRLTLLRPREAHLHYLTHLVEARKQAALEKLEAVYRYAESGNTCRSIVMLDYFDEKDAPECGVCDICLSKKKKEQENHTDLRSKIRSWIREGLRDPREMLKRIPTREEEGFQQVLQQLLDEGLLGWDDQHLLLWIKEE